MKIFIAGCARSGTRLLLELMSNFENMHVLDDEAPVTAFEDIADLATHCVVKRTFRCHAVLPDLRDDIHLIYCVRHPFDVLTSTNPRTEHTRRFHVTPERWRDEYRALNKLRRVQPNRPILVLPYEYLVTQPDAAQAIIARSSGLVPTAPFSNGRAGAIYTTSIGRWERNPECREHLRSLAPAFLNLAFHFCGEFRYSVPEDFVRELRRSATERQSSPFPLENPDVPDEPQTSPYKVKRLINRPIIRPDMLPGDLGRNINGPSLIRVPEWLPQRLGKYYLYFAHHLGDHIRLAYADRLEGPWQVHAPGTLKLADAPMCNRHIASPDMHIDDEAREICMIFHGPVAGGSKQMSYLARSKDGIAFTTRPTALAESYLRAVRWKDGWLGMSVRGKMYLSNSIEAPFQPIRGYVFDSYPSGQSGTKIRHVALRIVGSALEVFYTRTGDAPEQIWRCHIDLNGPPESWRTRHHRRVLAPETSWEGERIGVRFSTSGIARMPENALRDPALFIEAGNTYLLYSVAGEQGIAIARLEERRQEEAVPG